MGNARLRVKPRSPLYLRWSRLRVQTAPIAWAAYEASVVRWMEEVLFHA